MRARHGKANVGRFKSTLEVWATKCCKSRDGVGDDGLVSKSKVRQPLPRSC